MLKTKIEKSLQKAVLAALKHEKMPKEYAEAEIFTPENEQHGHYSSSIALKLAKILKKNPSEIAENIRHQISGAEPDFFKKIEIAPPGFINFWLADKTLQKELKEIIKNGENWGKPLKIKKQIAVIDYSHPNIAKPMHAGHFRSTLIGQALYNIFKFSGWKTIGDNHLGDWGKQFGILIAAYKEQLMAKKNNLRQKKHAVYSIDDLVKLYVDYTARIKTDPPLEEKARLEIKKLQGGDAENEKIWKKFYRTSLEEFKKVYQLLDVKFDYYLGESFYAPSLEKIVRDALKTGAAQKSQGAVAIFIKENQSPFIIQKSDGAYLYSTTDLAAIQYRLKKFKADLILYVVDNGQSLHFEQLFESARRLGYLKSQKLTHVKFGLLLGEDLKKLSTRAGKTISLFKVIEEGISRAKKIIDKKQPLWPERKKQKTAKAIGIASIKYNDLSQNRQSDIAFQWNKMLNLEGNSAPYLLYTYARIKSIIGKADFAKQQQKNIGYGELRYLTEENELQLIRRIEEFPSIIEQITKNYYPHHLTDYLYQLAKETNSYYHQTPVLKAETQTRLARLGLIAALAQTLKTGLNLLGIQTLEEM